MPPVIRPFTPPAVQTNATVVRQQPSADVRSAQRAFFQQALGDTTPASAPAKTAAVASTALRDIQPAVTRARLVPIPDEKPDRILRPGSFVDLKV